MFLSNHHHDFFFHLFIYFHEMQTENIRRISIWTIFQIYPSWRKAIMQGPTFGVSPLPSLLLAGVSPGSSFGQQLRLTQDWLKGEILQEWRCSPSDWLENISSSWEQHISILLKYTFFFFFSTIKMRCSRISYSCEELRRKSVEIFFCLILTSFERVKEDLYSLSLLKSPSCKADAIDVNLSVI